MVYSISILFWGENVCIYFFTWLQSFNLTILVSDETLYSWSHFGWFTQHYCIMLCQCTTLQLWKHRSSLTWLNTTALYSAHWYGNYANLTLTQLACFLGAIFMWEDLDTRTQLANMPMSNRMHLHMNQAYILRVLFLPFKSVYFTLKRD